MLTVLEVRDIKVVRPTHIYTGSKEEAPDILSKAKL